MSQAGGSELGKLFVPVVISAEQVRAAVREAGNVAAAEVRNIGDKLQSVGATLTKVVSTTIGSVTAAAATSIVTLDGAYRIIRSGTGATGKALQGLKDDFLDVARTSSVSIPTIAKTIADLNTRTGATGEGLKDLTRAFLGLEQLTGESVQSTLPTITRMFGDWSIASDDQTNKMNMLYRVSQQTGASISNLAAKLVMYGAPLRQMGFDWENAVAMMGKWEKEGVNTEIILSKLRTALMFFAKEGIAEPGKALDAFIKKLKNLESVSEANLLAGKLFGAEAGPDMAAAIREGRFEYDALLASIRSGTDTIEGVVAGTETWGGVMGKLGNRIIVAFAPMKEMTEHLKGGFKNAMFSATDALGSLVQKLADAPPWLQKSIILTSQFAMLAGPLAIGLGAVTKALTMLSWAGVKWGLAATAIITAGVMVYENFNEIKQGLLELYATFLETIRNIMSATADAVGSTRDWLLSGEGVAGSAGAAAYDLWSSIFGDPEAVLREGITGISKAAAEANRAAVQGMHDMAASSASDADSIASVMKEAQEQIAAVGDSEKLAAEAEMALDKALEKASGKAAKAKDAVLDMNRTLDDAQKKAVELRLAMNPDEAFLNALANLQLMADEFPDILDSAAIQDKVLSLWDQFGLAGTEAFQLLRDQLDDYGPEITKSMAALWNKAKLQDANQLFVEIAESIRAVGDASEEAKAQHQKHLEAVQKKWNNVAAGIEAAGQLVSAFGEKFRKAGMVAQTASRIIQIAVSGVNPVVMALQIAVEAVTAAFGLFGDEGEEEISRMDQMVSDLDQALTSFGDRFTDELVTLIREGKANWKDFTDYVIDELLRITLQYAVTEPLMEGIRVLYGSLFAKGAAFSGGAVVPFADGGVVSRPTLFPMKSGLGVMGENGPEAIMPLERTGDGSLGVKATGGGVVVNVHNYSGGTAEVSERTDPAGRRYIDVVIQDSVRRGMSGGAFDPDFLAFGLSRRGVTR